MARNTYFVTGTDTGVGKTFVTTALLLAAKAQGLRTLAMKPVASGCELTEDGLRNEDALWLQRAMTETLDYDQVNPVAFEPAIAPHVAALQAGRNLTAQRLAGYCRGVQMRSADLFLIEGAGGWRVPLNARESYAMVPQQLQVPVILVVGLRLGCINHALLTAEAIHRDGLRLAGWVGNAMPGETLPAQDECLDFLRHALPAPCLGVLSWREDNDPALAAPVLDLSFLLG